MAINVSTVTTGPVYPAPRRMLRAVVMALTTSETEFRPLLTSSLPMEMAVKEDQESFAAAVRVWRSAWRFSRLKTPANIFLLWDLAAFRTVVT